MLLSLYFFFLISLILSADIDLVVRPSEIIRENVPRTLFGSNLQWVENGDGLLDSNGDRIDTVWAYIKDQSPTVIRFSGGTFADYYHWEDGIEEPRPTTTTMPGDPDSKHTFGTKELFELLGHITSEGLLTTNLEDSAEMARWVKYIKDNDYDTIIKYWEIGNEQYFPGHLDPEGYAAKYLEFSRAMRVENSEAKFIGIGASYESFVNSLSPYTDWNQRVLDVISDEVDYVAVHSGYFPLMFEQAVLRDATVETVYKSLWGAPELFKESMATLSALIDTYSAGDNIKIAMTEWSCFFCLTFNSTCFKWWSHGKTIGSAVFMARMYQTFLEIQKLGIVNFFRLAGKDYFASITTTWHRDGEATKIDFIFVKGNFQIIDAKVVKNDISDHYMVYADLKLY